MRKFVSMISASMSDSERIEAKETPEQPTKKQKKRTSTSRASLAPADAGDEVVHDDRPPPCTSSSTFLEDAICTIDKAVDVANSRVPCSADRREKVMSDLCSLAMMFAWRGKDGLKWHNATYSALSALRSRMFEALLSFLNLATDFGAVSVSAVDDTDDVKDDAEEADECSTKNVCAKFDDALLHLDERVHAEFKAFALALGNMSKIDEVQVSD